MVITSLNITIGDQNILKSFWLNRRHENPNLVHYHTIKTDKIKSSYSSSINSYKAYSWKSNSFKNFYQYFCSWDKTKIKHRVEMILPCLMIDELAKKNPRTRRGFLAKFWNFLPWFLNGTHGLLLRMSEQHSFLASLPSLSFGLVFGRDTH